MARKTEKYSYKKPGRKYKYRKPRPLGRRPKGAAKSTDAKARSIQTSWRRYTGTSLPLPDAKQIIANPPQCIYCGNLVNWHDLSIDHKIPRSRGGADSADNLVFVDKNCNLSKGSLTDAEFTVLLQFLEAHPMMKTIVLTRLRAAGLIFSRRTK